MWCAVETAKRARSLHAASAVYGPLSPLRSTCLSHKVDADDDEEDDEEDDEDEDDEEIDAVKVVFAVKFE